MLPAWILRGQALAGVQDFKKLDSTPDLMRGCWNDEGGISCFVVTRRVMGVSPIQAARTVTAEVSERVQKVKVRGYVVISV
jgi:hypothetical protein